MLFSIFPTHKQKDTTLHGCLRSGKSFTMQAQDVTDAAAATSLLLPVMPVAGSWIQAPPQMQGLMRDCIDTTAAESSCQVVYSVKGETCDSHGAMGSILLHADADVGAGDMLALHVLDLRVRSGATEGCGTDVGSAITDVEQLCNLANSSKRLQHAVVLCIDFADGACRERVHIAQKSLQSEELSRRKEGRAQLWITSLVATDMAKAMAVSSTILRAYFRRLNPAALGRHEWAASAKLKMNDASTALLSLSKGKTGESAAAAESRPWSNEEVGLWWLLHNPQWPLAPVQTLKILRRFGSLRAFATELQRVLGDKEQEATLASSLNMRVEKFSAFTHYLTYRPSRP